MLLIEQLVGFLVHQDLVGIPHADAARLGAAAETLAEQIADGDRAHLRAGHSRNFEQRHAAAGGLDLDLDLLVVELAGAQFLAERVLGGGAGIGTHQRGEHPFFRGKLGSRLHVLALLLAQLQDRDLDEIAHDLLDVAADVADLGELRRLDLQERRAGELGEPPRDLGLAHAGRTDHQDVLRQHLLAQLLVELQPPPAIAQRDGDRALGVALADDEAVELGDDLARGKGGHQRIRLLRRPGRAER